MKEYKLFNTDGKTFFDFRSNPNSRCEGFTVSYLDDGTVVMSGDYGCLCWKRNYHHSTGDFNRDYGFPNKETGISYFVEKINQFGIQQKIKEWNKEKAIKMFEERYKELDYEEYDEVLNNLNYLEEYDEFKFFEEIRELDGDYWEYDWYVYTEHFLFMFEALKSVSEQILEGVKLNSEEAVSIPPNPKGSII